MSEMLFSRARVILTIGSLFGSAGCSGCQAGEVVSRANMPPKARMTSKAPPADEDLCGAAHVREKPAWVEELTNLAKTHFVKTLSTTLSSVLDKDFETLTAVIPIWAATAINSG